MKKADFYLRRLQSITGLFPMLLFLFMHTRHTGEQFITKVFVDHPMGNIIVMGIAPFAIHTIIGFYIIFSNKRKSNDIPSPKTKGVLYRLQIASAAIILIFVIFHVLIFDALRYNSAFFFPAAGLYFCAILALAWHFGYGLYTFSLTWGIAASARSRRAAAVMAIVISAVCGGLLCVFYIEVFINIAGMLGIG